MMYTLHLNTYAYLNARNCKHIQCILHEIFLDSSFVIASSTCIIANDNVHVICVHCNLAPSPSLL